MVITAVVHVAPRVQLLTSIFLHLMPDVVNISTTECQYFRQGRGVKDKLVFWFRLINTNNILFLET